VPALVWYAVVAAMLLGAAAALLAAPEVSLQYWYVLAAPVIAGAFRFGARGAAVTSGLVVLILLAMVQATGRSFSEATTLAQRLITSSNSPQEVQALALQVADLRAADPETSLFRALSGFALVVVGAIFLGTAVDHRQRATALLERTLRLLRRYFSPQIVEAILASGVAGSAEGETSRREVTVLFADLRSFTEVAERLEPEETAHLLNQFFTAMTDELFHEDGTLDKYLGDGLMAFFGDPVWYPDHPERALRAALAMQRRMPDLHEDWKRRGQPLLHMGIGISTGYATIGSTGSPARMEYTAIGSTVNVAARLSDLAGPGEILATRSTYGRAQDLVEAVSRAPEKVKGFANPVELVEVRGLRSAAQAPQPEPTAQFRALVTRIVDDAEFRTLLLAGPADTLAPLALTPEEAELVVGIARLAGCPTFAAVPPDEIVILAGAATVRSHDSGAIIIREGDPEREFYVILEGDVAVTALDDTQQERHLASLSQGDYFGEVAFLFDTPRTATVRSVSTVTLLILERDAFYRVLGAAPALRTAIHQTARDRASRPYPIRPWPGERPGAVSDA